MPTPRRDLRTDTLDEAFATLRSELDVPEEFPQEVLAAAVAATADGPTHERRDATDLPLLTIDPPGSKDLDQAVHVAALSGGALRVSYAIADVAAFVRPGDAIDVEAWHRGVSRYSPDRVTPLHPPELSEGVASLLPGEDRPAVLWTLTVDSSGELTGTHVERALVRSREQLTYAQAQSRIDAGTDPMLTQLSRLGRLRAEREWVRGGVSLELPDQEVIVHDDGTYGLAMRAPLPVESWNAQVSLLTGHAAGTLMESAGIGILRTLPAPDDATIQTLRRRAWALGLPWPVEISYPDFVRTLDPHQPTEAAMISLAAVGLRGAGYAAFDGAVPEHHRHEAIAAVYAHVTAPLRRLVDRYASEIALAVAAERPVPPWVRDRLADLPKAMARAGGRAAALDRAVVDLVEAHLLADDVGRTLAATVVRSDANGSELQLRNPAVLVRAPETLPLGAEVAARIDAVDTLARSVTVTAV